MSLHDLWTSLQNICSAPVTNSKNTAVPNKIYKNSSGDEIANVNFYAVRPEATRIRWNKLTQNNAITPFKAIQGHRFWYQSKAHIRFPISD